LLKVVEGVRAGAGIRKVYKTYTFCNSLKVVEGLRAGAVIQKVYKNMCILY
jgi:hypothetical protein